MSSFADPNIPSQATHGASSHTTHGPTIPLPQTLTPELVSHGNSIGIDVEKLRNKYINVKLNLNSTVTDEQSLKAKQQIDDAQRLRELEEHYENKANGVNGVNGANGTNGVVDEAQAAHEEERRKLVEASQRLDRLVLCSRCAGQGMYKHHYNFQVKDVNCEVCDSEGLLYKSDDGTLVHKKYAPVIQQNRQNQQNQHNSASGRMTDDIAMELARNCGVSKNNDDPLKLREGDIDIDMPPNF